MPGILGILLEHLFVQSASLLRVAQRLLYQPPHCQGVVIRPGIARLVQGFSVLCQPGVAVADLYIYIYHIYMYICEDIHIQIDR